MKQKSVLRRSTQTTGIKELIDLPPGRDVTDRHLKPNETYLYELGLVDSGVFRTFASQTVTIPEDLVVKGTVVISKQTTSSFKPYRIFIGDHGQLLTDGQSIKIETNEIYSDNGTIASFDSAKPAAANVRGRSGGTLTVFATKIIGHLTIAMRGETGGGGTPGLPGVDYNGTDGMGPTSGSPGGQGAPGGNSGVLHLAIRDFHKDNLLVLIEPGIGGSGGPGGRNGEGNGGGYAPSGLKGYDGQLDTQTEDWK